MEEIKIREPLGFDVNETGFTCKSCGMVFYKGTECPDCTAPIDPDEEFECHSCKAIFYTVGPCPDCGAPLYHEEYEEMK